MQRQHKPQKPPVPPKGSQILDSSLEQHGGEVRRYVVGDLLGLGGFASCVQLQSVASGRIYAGKFLHHSFLNQQLTDKLHLEIKIHRACRHPNIVSCIRSIDNYPWVVVLMDVCENKSIADFVKLRRNNRLTETETQFFVWQILDAIHYMHSHNIIHRDLKLGNIFLDRGFCVKIGDFGLATRLDNSSERKHTRCGTPNYIAPEVLDDSGEGHSFEVDIWALGVITYTLLYGRPPFETDDLNKTYNLIRAHTFSFPQSSTISKQAQDFIASMFRDGSQRPTLKQLREHPFFTQSPFPQQLTSPQPLPFTHFTLLTTEQQQAARSQLPFVPTTWTPLTDYETAENPKLSRFATANLQKRKEKEAQSEAQIKAQQAGKQQPQYQQVQKQPSQSSAPMASISASSRQRIVPTSDQGAVATKQRPAVQQQPTQPLQPVQPNLPLNNNLYPSSSHYAPLPLPVPHDPVKTQSAVFQPQNALTRVPTQIIQQPQLNQQQSRSRTQSSHSIENAQPMTDGCAGYYPSAIPHQHQQQQQQHQPYSSALSNRPFSQQSQQIQSPPQLQQQQQQQQLVQRQPSPPQPRGLAGVPQHQIQPNHNHADIWVNLWVDYSSRYGIGYILSNGSSGVCFNDNSILILHADSVNCQYISASTTNPGELEIFHFINEQHPPELNKKAQLLKHFLSFLIRYDTNTMSDDCGFEGPQGTQGAPAPGCPNWRDHSAPFDLSTATTLPMPHVKSFNSCGGENDILVLRLSNKTTQLLFAQEHSELIVDVNRDTIIFTDPQQNRFMASITNWKHHITSSSFYEKVEYVSAYFPRVLYPTNTSQSAPQTNQQQHHSTQQQQQQQQQQFHQQQFMAQQQQQQLQQHQQQYHNQYQLVQPHQQNTYGMGI